MTRFSAWLVEKFVLDSDRETVRVLSDLDGAVQLAQAILTEASDPDYDADAATARVRPCGPDGKPPVGGPVWHGTASHPEGEWTQLAHEMAVNREAVRHD